MSDLRMVRMSYRAKLLAALMTTALVTTGCGTLLMYELAHRAVFEGFRAKALAIAATIASQIDGDLHASLHGRGDESSESYSRLKAALRRARDSNRNDSTFVKYVFTLYRAPQDPNVLLIGVNPEESLEAAAHLGDVYHGKPWRAELAHARVDTELRQDEFGVYLGATAPVFNHSGTPVALVKVEFAADRVRHALRPVLWSGAAALALAATLAFAAAVFFAGRVSRPLTVLQSTIERIGAGDLDARLNLTTGDEFESVAHSVNAMAAGLKERETVKSAFARYVSRQVMDSVLRSGELPSVHGERRKVTVLFCDIRGFSTIAEKMRPEEVVAMLNEYFERMVDVIFRHQGTLDKFLGDGLMVIFGAPDDDPYQEEHAVRAALEMRASLVDLCAKWKTEGRAGLRIGIGINSGPAVVGNIGSSQRMEYTAIGDTVNLASRLEAATKEQGVDILMSEYTYNAVRGVFATHSIGSIRVKGREDMVQTYALESTPAPDESLMAGTTVGIPPKGEADTARPAR